MKKVRKTVASPILLSGVVIFIFILPLCCFLFFVLYPYGRERITVTIWIIIIVLFIGFPIILFLGNARKLFTIITMDEKGISRSLFGTFFKLSMKWEEIYEISYYESLIPFIMFSETKSLRGITYKGTGKIKNLIQLQLTQKNYDFIKQYIKQPIIGLTDAKMAQLKLKK